MCFVGVTVSQILDWGWGGWDIVGACLAQTIFKSRRANTSSGQRRCELYQSALPHPLTWPTSKLVLNVDHSANYPYGNKSSESAKSMTASTSKPQRRIRKRKSRYFVNFEDRTITPEIWRQPSLSRTPVISNYFSIPLRVRERGSTVIAFHVRFFLTFEVNVNYCLKQPCDFTQTRALHAFQVCCTKKEEIPSRNRAGE